MSKKIALLTGITGQDSSFMCELLLSKGYEVHGVLRRSSIITTERIENIRLNPNFHMHFGDLSDGLSNLIYELKPDELYNFAAMSQVRVSFDQPIYTFDINATGVIRLLESIRILSPKTKFYQATSSECFGMSPPIQNENTPFQPCSPYGISKVCAFWSTITYRDSYKLFATTGILFNHEGERRGETFVTKKIIRAACRIKLGIQNELILGNIESKRDRGYYKDYMECVYKIMQHENPDVFCVASGQHYSIKEFLQIVFEKLNLDWEEYIKFDHRLLRPKELPDLCGSAEKANKILGWEPKVGIHELIEIMIKHCMIEEQNKLHIEGIK